jgi:multidrug resistance efflux pump
MSVADRVSRLALYFLSFALFALVLAGCATEQADDEELLTASGFIEGQEVTVASQIQGLVTELLVARGDSVSAGDVVARLDDAALRSQRGEAQAALSTAQANLDRVLAGARAEAIAAAEAGMAKAEAARDGARQAVLNAREVISHPLSLDAQIDEARTQIDLAEQTVELHEAELEETRMKRNLFAEQGGDVARTWDLEFAAAEARLSRAHAELDGARSTYWALLDQRDNPLALEAELHRAQAELEQAEARVEETQAALAELEAGPAEEAVALAQAQVRQAEAGVALIDAQLDQLTLRAPMDGIVSTRSAQVGETATAGRPLLTIANLDKVTLVLYIPENRIGQVQIGQEVEVSVDSFPERVFVGQVASIAGEAEFTPRNVQTQEERVNLVFAVDVAIPNPDRALKPGMPADAVVRP